LPGADIFAAAARACTGSAALAQRLIAAASPNPPGDTRAVAAVARALLQEAILGVEVTEHAADPAIVNLVARVCSGRPGRRLVFNGHLDTYPIGADLGWTVDPLGERVGDRLYGRGAADMKGGIAASISALALLAHHRDLWSGEAVLTLAGDEESMGPLGTQFLMETVPHAVGDAVIIGDVGSPRVLRFGEKGFIWIEIEAAGHMAHGAHVHRGVNAIDRLRAALDALTALRDLTPAPPEGITRAISESRAISEPLSGAGEADVLSRVTVNIGRIEGGVSPNLVPASARAAADIRLPVGVSLEAVEATLAAALGAMEGVTWRILRRFAPNHTDPGHELVRCCVQAATAVLGSPPAVNMRVGGSDARWFRMRGIPTVVYGPTPFNMGGADEYVLVSELDIVARVHALAAFAYLTAPTKGAP
jgi:succinyl-diaminopimelate desuccinylase